MAFAIELMLKKQGIWALIRCIFPVKTTHIKTVSVKRMIDHLDFAPLPFLAHFLYNVLLTVTQLLQWNLLVDFSVWGTLALSGGAQQGFLPMESETAQQEEHGPYRHSTFRKTKVKALPELGFFPLWIPGKMLYVPVLTQRSLKSMQRLLLTLMSSGLNPKAITWSKLPPNCKYGGVLFAMQI